MRRSLARDTPDSIKNRGFSDRQTAPFRTAVEAPSNAFFVSRVSSPPFSGPSKIISDHRFSLFLQTFLILLPEQAFVKRIGVAGKEGRQTGIHADEEERGASKQSGF